jgi:hypothetical protein
MPRRAPDRLDSILEIHGLGNRSIYQSSIVLVSSIGEAKEWGQQISRRTCRFICDAFWHSHLARGASACGWRSGHRTVNANPTAIPIETSRKRWTATTHGAL